MSVGTQLRKIMRTPPMRFQVRGVRFMESHGGRILLGDDMGLGKTYQTIAWAALHPEVRPVLIVCPATLKYHWQRQFKIHAGLQAEVLDSQRARKVKNKIAIINYEILHYWKAQLMKWAPALVVVDECHRVKTCNIKRTRVCKSLSTKARYFMGLSGTPIINRPIEFYPILNMIDSKSWNSRLEFAFRYCAPHRGFRGRWDFSGAENLDELHERVSRVMLRRKKSEVLKDLPPKRRTPLPVDIDRREYNKAEDHFLEWLRERAGDKAALRASRAPALVKLSMLKRIAAEGLFNAACEWIDNYVLESREKLVVFALHRDVLGFFRRRYTNAAFLDGNLPQGLARQEAVDTFQGNKSCRLLFGSRVAWEGWTLTSASTALFLEVGWTPGEHEQAEDRLLRIGQTASCVNIYYMIPRNTVVEKAMELIEEKREVVSQVLDGSPERDTRNTIDRLLRYYCRRI